MLTSSIGPSLPLPICRCGSWAPTTRAALADVRENLKAQLAPTLGIEVGYTVAEAFVACVAACKREIEAAAGGQKESFAVFFTSCATATPAALAIVTMSNLLPYRAPPCTRTPCSSNRR